MLKKILVVLFSSLLIMQVSAVSVDTYNLNFSAEMLAPWQSGGTVSLISPTAEAPEQISTAEYLWKVFGDGQMAKLIPSGPNYSPSTIADLFKISEANAQEIFDVFKVPNKAGITNYAYIYVDVAFDADEALTMYWNYIATDYEPFNDASVATFVDVNVPSNLGKINDELKTSEILGATVLGTGKYSTGSYGSTGWQTITFQATEAGTYRLGFMIFNLDDTALSPILFVDNTQGTTLKDDTSFDPISPDPNAPEIGKIKVTFDPNNSTSNFAVNVDANATVSAPTAPTKAGSAFVEWRLNGTAFDFTTPITQPITLVAHYIAVNQTVNTPPTLTITVEGLASSLNLTTEEIAQGVSLQLDIEVKEAEQVDAGEKTLLDNFVAQSIAEGTPQVFILDINMFKTITGSSPTPITNLDQPILIKFTLPELLRGKVVQVVRVHNGVPESLEFTYNSTTFELAFYTDRFSTYGLVYGDNLVLNESNESQNNSPTPNPTSNPSSGEPLPRTSGLSDFSLIFALLGAGVLFLERKLR